MTLRTRLLWVIAAVLVVALGTYGYVQTTRLDGYYNEAMEETLVDYANMVAEVMAQQPDLSLWSAVAQSAYRRNIGAEIYRFRKEAIDSRIIVTDRLGIVQFDSLDPSTVGEDWSNWRDIRLTLQGAYGARSSEDNTMALLAAIAAETLDPALESPNHEGASASQETVERPSKSRVKPLGRAWHAQTTAWVAAPIERDGELIGVVSVGKPKRNIVELATRAQNHLIFTAVMVLAAMLLVALLLQRWIARPVRDLTSYARAVSEGRRIELPKLVGGELAEVGAAMETMRRSLDEKSRVERYVEIVSHELKSPLAAIRASAELLESDLEPASRLHFATTIQQQVNRLDQFAAGALALSALEQQAELAAPQSVVIGECIADLAATWALRAAPLSVQVRTVVSGQPMVFGSAELIAHALDNLVSNAVDFSPQGGVVDVHASQDGQQVRIVVIDRGPGFPAYSRERLFERFYSTARPDGRSRSSGLGLNIVRQITDLHHGQIEIDRDPERAETRATLILPVSIENS
ncbi:ATP-binding protein [Gammaproteobacteria bacterium]|nr:ATP-binding protein [Gammaproteobacteria bacterium]